MCMMSMDLFHEIPDYPEKVSGASVLVRLLDGLGFRFRWSTDGLSDEDYTFRPAPDCMSIGACEARLGPGELGLPVDAV